MNAAFLKHRRSFSLWYDRSIYRIMLYREFIESLEPIVFAIFDPQRIFPVSQTHELPFRKGNEEFKIYKKFILKSSEDRYECITLYRDYVEE